MFVFSNFGVRHVASQRFSFTTTLHLYFFGMVTAQGSTWPKAIYTYIRLQLKRGLFWYRHYPKFHQMVKYASSRALVWTICRQITLRVFFTSNKWKKNTIWSNKNTNMLFFVKTNLWEATCLIPKLEKPNVPIWSTQIQLI